MEHEDKYLTIFEAAEITRFKVSSLRKYVLDREIPYHKVRRAIRFKLSEIKAWMESQEKKGATGPRAAAGQGELGFEEKR
jgi:excisionase family DNA binding protein